MFQYDQKILLSEHQEVIKEVDVSSPIKSGLMTPPSPIRASPTVNSRNP